MVLPTGNLAWDEIRYLWIHNYNLAGIIEGAKPKKPTFEYSTNLQRAVQCTMPIVLTFWFSVIACLVWWPLAVLCRLVVGYIVGRLVCSLFVLLLSVVVGKIYKNHHEKSVVYWSWFPCWTFFLCFTAAIAGFITGGYLWVNYWQQYSEVSVLKAYRGIDPSFTPGQQIQDVGAVDFMKGTGLDKESAGCFLNAGSTYCIAPIVSNAVSGSIDHSLGGAPEFGSYDYFAVGVNCCKCPGLDFQCGDWRNPSAHGGIRSTDVEARPFFRLAVDAWASANRKTVGHPIFLDWVESPVAHWADLHHRFFKNLAIAMVIPVILVLGFTLTLARLHQAMVVHGLASVKQTPAPPEGFESAWSRFLPEMLARYEEEEEERQAKAGAAYGSAVSA
mmetsp:Transcript_46769/g.84449  ORF Transcript_46769/g.84449 Transcript_46769/m.84449 type:complete len:388 (+) Transcript_46769:77-1240(+)|eukprot:CAMPEP_0197621950 /NCGR_PEP_ID=MMETSP1338-20131121/2366_1 /TAXON_ID=43686 ORGANISM="Pelagodinium beii, Strain RCC1491" /NCGR_SAMPLE_ID=MMETSP1338 /ASSEMBLY_ACC=CAM_ASM_000754 /LENGTH=387 /DNA_ID=CAMNT_0043191535 /DNA_START=62 /DNA_END=1225 /DNA_ORIENTATION=-